MMSSLDPPHMSRSDGRRLRWAISRQRKTNPAVDRWIVEYDYLPVKLYRVRDKYRVSVGFLQTDRDARFPVAGGAIEEKRRLRNKRRADLIHKFVGQQQV